MQIKKLTVIPNELRQLSQPPKQLFELGASLNDLLQRPRLAIVGNRSISAYGRQVTAQLARQLAEQGIVIISGLALGVDGVAHRGALEAKGLTIAVLPAPLDDIVPATHRQLAEAILEQGGTLISEYPSGEFAAKQNFIARNRLMAGLAQAVLITEAGEKSGSLHTARFALEQGIEVLAVPGPITSSGSVGVNNLIKAGATPITSYTDALNALKLREHIVAVADVRGRNAHEQAVLELLVRGVNDGEQLLQKSDLSINEFNQVLTMLEIGGQIRSLGANQWALR
jgi:DNA processing protein